MTRIVTAAAALLALFLAACDQEPGQTAPQGPTNQQLQPQGGQPRQ